MALAGTDLHAREKFSYGLDIQGFEKLPDSTVRQTFENHSVLLNKNSEPFASVSNLRARLKQDVDLMRRILRAEGYYNNQITEKLSRRENRFDVIITLIPGPRYILDKIEITYTTTPDEEIREKAFAALALEKGTPLRSEETITAQTRMIVAFPELGFPFARVEDRKIVVDHATRTASVEFIVTPGIRIRFGNVEFEGLSSVNESYPARMISWQPGEFFSQQKVDDLRSRLSGTGLFRSIKITLADQETVDRDIIVEVTENKHRTISVSGGYATSDGLSSDASWQHRNIFGNGEKLLIGAHLAEIEQSLSARLDKPNFRRLDQTLIIETSLKNENTDAYDALTADGRVGLERLLTNNLAASVSVFSQYSDISNSDNDRNYWLAALPVGVRWDNSNDILDPTKGFRASVSTAPSFIFNGSNEFYLRSEINVSGYYPLDGDHDFVLAARARVGSVYGISFDELPAKERFFSGGGGSVRGYGYQDIGPRDASGDPTGGRSVAEINAEMRVHISDTLSLVPFMDGGNVYEKVLPRFTGFRWGAGLGVRYHTSFGPLRVDAATPLNRLPGESRFHLYISLGQAF
ncbi:autotransporter assembly complex family protein [Emcibacter sp.]|uniref:autotransporter assembly complex protein TamA n=1 Tax=Emcibacter sp. TaxID=1979954 RepID=UPI002AA5ECD8|nr:autotransporter assembly complex family protein [Emcibacter sp.]